MSNMIERYDYELEDIIGVEIPKDELQELKDKLKFVREFIEKNCVYDEHLQGYIFDLPKGKVRTLMYNIKEIK